MSTAMNKVTVTRLKDGTTYTAQIVCSIGDLIQYFDATTVSPDWSAAGNHPVLVFHAVSSLGTGETDLVNMTLYYDGVKIAANDDRFRLSKDKDDKLWRCTILKNLISPGPATNSNNAGHTIRMEGQTSDEKKIQATIAISCAPKTDSGRRAVIVAGDTNCFTVDQDKGTSCILKAMFNDKGDLTTPPNGYTYQWYRQNPSDVGGSGWTPVIGAASQTLTVKASDVETMQVYRVCIQNSANTNEKYYDTQSVMDVGDPYLLHITVYEGGSTTNVRPAIFEQTEASTAYRTLVPKIVSRKSGNEFTGSVSYYWSIMAADGVYANGSQTTIGGQTIPAHNSPQTPTAANPAKLNLPAELVDKYGQIEVICEGVFNI